MRLLGVLLGGVLTAGLISNPVAAEGVALVVGNAVYRNITDVPGADTVLTVVPNLEAAGYRVIEARNASLSALKFAVSRFEAALPDADRAIVVLSGRFLNSGNVTWFAPVNLGSSSLSDIAFEGLSLNAILSFLATKPGGAGLFLGSDGLPFPVELVSIGVGSLSAPQGVIIVKAEPEALVTALQDHFIVPGTSLRSAVSRAGNTVSAVGYISGLSSLAPEEEPTGGSAFDRAFLAEQAYWQLVVDLNTIQAYESYKRRYPNGMFDYEVDARLRTLEEAAPKVPPDELAELNLTLSRSDRRRVQEQLSLLGFNPRGIDGLFGPGSRNAIKRWQAQNGERATGFLTTATMRALRSQAEEKARQLADEARQKQAETDAADAVFWRATGANGHEADLLAYLRKYPDGLFADTARAQLARIEDVNRNNALVAETALWDAAVASESPLDYRAYLQAYPNGVFADAARARLDALALDQENSEAVNASKAEEKRIELNRYRGIGACI